LLSRIACLLTSSLLLGQVPSANLKTIRSGLDQLYPSLNALYMDLHQHPELSTKETRTAQKMAEQLKRLGFEVTTGVGGTGVVGLFRNGKGPTLLVRTELDALPVLENTGLDCASLTPGVMHACGHDVHMTVWTGTAETLVKLKRQWHGTLMMVGQPAEENVVGARAMVKDGLLTRFPKPDFTLALHDTPDLPAGKVAYVEGAAFANMDSVDIALYGKGGHGARPEVTIDPIVLAARVVMALQTIISREKSPLEPAVITVGSIHGGTRYNIIPDEVKLQLTVRTVSPEGRKQMLDAIARVAKAEAAAVGAPREPVVAVAESVDYVWNDPPLTRRIASMLGRELGPENVIAFKGEMGSEDFGEFGQAAEVPSTMLRLGASEPKQFQDAKASGNKLPGLHSARFAPDRERTVRTGVEVMVLSALDILGGKP